MRELVCIEKGRLEWRERPAPALAGERAALVRPLVVSRCDLDLPLVTGRVPIERPFAVGHEFVAEVLEVGAGVTKHAPGAHVCVPFQISCGECERCRRGHTGACSAVPLTAAYGMGLLMDRDWGGALSDAVLVPFADAMLVPLPEGLAPWLAVGASDNILDGYRLVAGPLAELPGARVLVVSGGGISVALYAVAAARALGAAEVVYIDGDRTRCAIAEQLGARVIDSARYAELKPGRFPIVVDASADPEGLRLCLRSTEVEGICSSAGLYTGDVALPLWEMYVRGARFVTGRAHARALLPLVLPRIQDGSLRVEAIEPRRVPWNDADRAWLEPSLKLIVCRA